MKERGLNLGRQKLQILMHNQEQFISNFFTDKEPDREEYIDPQYETHVVPTLEEQIEALNRSGFYLEGSVRFIKLAFSRDGHEIPDAVSIVGIPIQVEPQ